MPMRAGRRQRPSHTRGRRTPIRARSAALAAALVLALLAAGAAPAPVGAADPGTGSGPIPQVVGGQPATAGAWPSMVGLLAAAIPDATAALFCGGTLVAPDWVLTADHCVVGLPGPSAVDVLVGQTTLSGTGGQRVHAAQIVRNPAANQPVQYANDVALIRLAQPVTAPVQALAAPGQEGLYATTGTPATVVGWGVTCSRGCPISDTLQEAVVPVDDDATCSTAWGSSFKSALMLCAGALHTTGPDTCNGDSGGPLFVHDDHGAWIQAGITSFGPQSNPTCANPNQPGVYTEVAAARAWIDSMIVAHPPPSIVAITPHVFGIASAPHAVTITGANLPLDAQVDAGPGVSVTGLTVVSGQVIRAQLGVAAGTPRGWRDLTVRGATDTVVCTQCVLLADAPGSPTDVGATVLDDAIRVSWAAPADDGGVPVTSYTVTALPSGATVTVAGASTTADVSGLTGGVPVRFVVTAANVIGTGPASTPSPAAVPRSFGYWILTGAGLVFAYGVPAQAQSGVELADVAGIAPHPDGRGGYWAVTGSGVVTAVGVAHLGDLRDTSLNRPIVGMAATASGRGSWLVASDGGLCAFGDAGFFGSTGAVSLNRPIVGMAATPSGRGYWLVASDGGLFAFGDAGFFGSTGAMSLNRPIVGMAASPSGHGYWLVATDGGLFAFGDAAFFGSTGSIALNRPIVGMAVTRSAAGYWLVASDGGIFAFGDATFLGSTGGQALTAPVIGLVAVTVG
jgi:secreted trypsin-like serine protease